MINNLFKQTAMAIIATSDLIDRALGGDRDMNLRATAAAEDIPALIAAASEAEVAIQASPLPMPMRRCIRSSVTAARRAAEALQLAVEVTPRAGAMWPYATRRACLEDARRALRTASRAIDRANDSFLAAKAAAKA